MQATIDLDHLAIASRGAETMARTFIADFGGEFHQGGAFDTMRAIQVRFQTPTGSVSLELIEPPPGAGGFLDKFLSHRRPGAHHLTFRADRLEEVIRDIEDHGIEPTGVRLDNVVQKEVFIRPRDGFGMVVQVVEKADTTALEGELADWYRLAMRPWWSPLPAPHPDPLTITSFVLRVNDLANAVALYSGPLGGSPVAKGDGWVELTWPSTCVRLIEDSPQGFSHVEVEASTITESLETDAIELRPVTAREATGDFTNTGCARPAPKAR